MWEMHSKPIEDYLNLSVRNLSNHQAAFSTYYWGIVDCHFDNLRHRHSFFEVCYVVHGIGSYHETGASISLQPGTLFLSKPGVIHQIRSQTGIGIVFAGFDLDRVRSAADWVERYDALASTPKLSSVVGMEAEVVSAIWRSLCLAVSRNAHHDTIQSLALALFTSIPNAFGIPQTASHRPSVPTPLVERAVKFIGDNVANPLPLGAVASYLHVSERYLSKVLKQSCKMSYNAWITHQRILLARELLLHTELPIKVIAEKSGFSSVHYFTNVFKQQCQLTPARYRAQHGTHPIR